MNSWNFYTAKELKPQGWLRDQLVLQARGLSGNLDRIWRDVRDSAWIGGDAEGWERVPYWLDGFIPLAYLLEDEDMIARAKKYIDAILSYQQPDGWICPCKREEIPTYDSWAVQLISKVLVVYYECSGDERIPSVLYRVMKNYFDLLSDGTVKLFAWGERRWFEAFVALRFLEARYREPWIRELAALLHRQGTDYAAHTEKWKRPLNKWTQETHIVNLAMMLKSEALSHELLEQSYTDRAEALVQILKTYNGTPVGVFTGDECLSGLSPIQGTELCAVAEQMYSYEWLYAVTGDAKWAERLETVAFNALPATISDDMWTHQYDQLSNQIACIAFPNKPIFRTNGKESHLFGLEPNFGCCTANFNQAWPKLALSTFLHRKGEVVCALPIPSELRTEDLVLSLKTNYPFENQFVYTAEAKKDVTLRIRIPSFARNLRVDGEQVCACGELVFRIRAGETRTLKVSFDTVPELIDRPHDLKTVRCGSLVFSLPISYEKQISEYVRNNVERKFPYCDYAYVPTSEWSFAYASFPCEAERQAPGEIPFSSEKPPVTIKIKVRPIAWGLEDGYETVCAKIPQSRTPLGEEREITLYPYGCAKLRMTELPLV